MPARCEFPRELCSGFAAYFGLLRGEDVLPALGQLTDVLELKPIPGDRELSQWRAAVESLLSTERRYAGPVVMGYPDAFASPLFCQHSCGVNSVAVGVFDWDAFLETDIYEGTMSVAVIWEPRPYSRLSRTGQHHGYHEYLADRAEALPADHVFAGKSTILDRYFLRFFNRGDPSVAHERYDRFLPPVLIDRERFPESEYADVLTEAHVYAWRYVGRDTLFVDLWEKGQGIHDHYSEAAERLGLRALWDIADDE